MRTQQLIYILESYPDAEVYVSAEYDVKIADLIVVGNRIILVPESTEDDDVLTFDIVELEDITQWQIVYSTGVIRHKPIGKPINDYLVAEAVVARLHRNALAFQMYLSNDTADQYVDKLSDSDLSTGD